MYSKSVSINLSVRAGVLKTVLTFLQKSDRMIASTCMEVEEWTIQARKLLTQPCHLSVIKGMLLLPQKILRVWPE